VSISTAADDRPQPASKSSAVKDAVFTQITAICLTARLICLSSALFIPLSFLLRKKAGSLLPQAYFNRAGREIQAKIYAASCGLITT